MAPRHTLPGGVKTIDTMFAIIEAIEDLDGAGVTELANRLDLAKSTVHGHVTSLHEKQYLVKDNDKYRVGLQFLRDGAYALGRYQTLLDAATPRLQELANKTDETVWLVVEEHGQAVCIEIAKGPEGISTGGKIGSRFLMHSGAGGKSILAHMDSEEAEDIIDRYGLPKFTDQTIISRDALFEELEMIREQGYAFNKAESHPAIHTVGAPILVDGGIQGAVVVSGPRNRLVGSRFTEEIPEYLLATCNEIELRMSFE